MKITLIVDVPLIPVIKQGAYSVLEFKVEWTDDALPHRIMALYEKGEKKTDNLNDKQKDLIAELFEAFVPMEWLEDKG